MRSSLRGSWSRSKKIRLSNVLLSSIHLLKELEDYSIDASTIIIGNYEKKGRKDESYSVVSISSVVIMQT